jgi:archaellum component FlaC
MAEMRLCPSDLGHNSWPITDGQPAYPRPAPSTIAGGDPLKELRETHQVEYSEMLKNDLPSSKFPSKDRKKPTPPLTWKQAQRKKKLAKILKQIEPQAVNEPVANFKSKINLPGHSVVDGKCSAVAPVAQFLLPTPPSGIRVIDFSSLMTAFLPSSKTAFKHPLAKSPQNTLTPPALSSYPFLPSTHVPVGKSHPLPSAFRPPLPSFTPPPTLPPSTSHPPSVIMLSPPYGHHQLTSRDEGHWFDNAALIRAGLMPPIGGPVAASQAATTMRPSLSPTASNTGKPFNVADGNRHDIPASSYFLLPTPPSSRRIREPTSLSMKLPHNVCGFLPSRLRSTKKTQPIPTSFYSNSFGTLGSIGEEGLLSPSSFSPLLPRKNQLLSASEAGRTPPPSPPQSPLRLKPASRPSSSLAPSHGLLGGAPPEGEAVVMGAYKTLGSIFGTANPEGIISHQNFGMLNALPKPTPTSSKIARLPPHVHLFPPCEARLDNTMGVPTLRVDISGIPVKQDIDLNTLHTALAGVGITPQQDAGFSSRTHHNAFKNNNYTATHSIVSLTVVNDDNLWHVINGDTAVYINSERLGIQLNHISTQSSEFSCQVSRGPLSTRRPTEPMSIVLASLHSLGWAQEDVAQYIARTVRNATGLKLINVTFTTTTKLTTTRRPAAIAFWDYRGQTFLHFATQEDLDAYIHHSHQTPLSLNFTPELLVPLSPMPRFRERPTPSIKNPVHPVSDSRAIVRFKGAPESASLTLLENKIMGTFTAYDNKLNSLNIQFKAMKDQTSTTNSSFSTKLTSLESNVASLHDTVTAYNNGYEGVNEKIERLEGKIERLLQAIVKPSSPLSPALNGHHAA